MKKYRIAIIFVVVAFAIAFAQQEDRKERWQRWQEARKSAIGTIEKEVAKLKTAFEEDVKRRETMGSWRELSEEQRAKMREEFGKRRKERQQVIATIEQQLAKLKGSRQLRAEHDESIGELKSIYDAAVSENASQTAEKLSETIEKREKAFAERLKELGLEERGVR